MVIGTRKSNAAKHPGRLLTDIKQQRRTRTQIEEDEARRKAAAVAAEEDAKAKHQAIVTRVADIEDSMERDEEVIRAYSNRPDFRNPLADLENDTDVEDELEIDNSDDSEAFRFNDRDLSGCDSEDEDQIDSDSSSTIRESTARKRKGKKKTKSKPNRGDFRREVNAARSVSKSLVPVQDSSMKRTASGRTSPQTLATPGLKRLKRSNAFHEGLMQDWRAGLTKLRRPSRNDKRRLTTNTGTDIEDGEVSEGPHRSGEFDQDEPEEVLQRVKASKSLDLHVQAFASSGSGYPTRSRSTTPAISQWGGGPGPGPLVTRKTEQMGIQIAKVDSTTKDSDATANRKNGRRQKYTILDLPYPPGGKNSENWKLLNAMVLSWAGAQEDPFSTNSKLDMEIDMLWESVFPGSILDVQGRKRVLVVCGNSLNNWRSDIGKAGHQAALSMLHASREYPHDKTRCKKIVSDALYDFRFIYEKPDNEVNRGPFCSAFVSKVFAVHLQKIIHSKHGLQIGGLALVAAAVERGLGLFKTGEDALELKEDTESHSGKERSRNVRSRDLAFSDNPWGGVAREFIRSIKNLEKSHWESIYTHATEYMGRSEQIVDREGHFPGDGDSESEAIRPRARIQID